MSARHDEERAVQVRPNRENDSALHAIQQECEIPFKYTELVNMALTFGIPVLKAKLPMKKKG